MKKVAVISAIIEQPDLYQKEFNDVVSNFKSIIIGRMGIPVDEGKIGVVSLTIIGTLDQINSLTGKLGNIPHVLVKTAVSKKELE
jgi:putative iron-only hydrogenase system regulator